MILKLTTLLHSLPKGVFIARGSSGWTKKVVVSGKRLMVND
jgi:hypothetical protein